MEEPIRKPARGALIGGAPISQVAIWAAIIAVTGMIPFSVVIGGGGTFPISSTLAPLSGILLGPIGGFVAVIIGGYIDLAIAPYTATLGLASPWSLAIATLCAGLIAYKPKNYWWIPAILAPVAIFWTYASFPIAGLTFPYAKPLAPFEWLEGPYVGFLLGWTDAWPSWILFLATVKWLRKWISSTSPIKVGAAIWIITYFTLSGIEHYIGWGIFEIMYKLTLDVCVWVILLFTWWERLVMATVGGIIGTAVVFALRRAGLRKPEYTIW
ncbi:MAG: hypothetical protein QXG01_02430 [Candidatus Bathyarchaeia archaeon]